MERASVLYLGRKPYSQVHGFQLELIEKRRIGEIPDQLLLVEHPPVITIGRGGSQDNIRVSQEVLKENNISVHHIERGGDVTYHGPGQLVGYPILNLKEHEQDLHWLLRSYEDVILKVLEKHGIQGKRLKEYPGVWVDDKKIAAIGVAVKKWVTYHGFAFNINPNMEHFKYIIPCGIKDRGVTSLKLILGSEPPWEEIQTEVIMAFGETFNREMV